MKDRLHSSDRLIAVVLLFLLSPAIAAATIALRLERSGPILRRSPRLGRNAVPFDLYGFRTMRDGRLTPTGRILRRFSLDHLPMLVNVLRGDLALVGPRPTEPDRIDLTVGRWRTVLLVRPGLVSHAIVQLGSRYNNAPPDEQMAVELDYVRRAGPRFDRRLLREAARAFVSSRGNVKAHR
jgi:lipopolysaccharide/colanic/teichoic acid biosynthesis glycosyltransferase